MKILLLLVLAAPAPAAELILPCRQAVELRPQIEAVSESGVEFAHPSMGDCRIKYVLRQGESLPAFVDKRTRRLAIIAELRDMRAKFVAGTDLAADRRRVAEIVMIYLLDQENE